MGSLLPRLDACGAIANGTLTVLIAADSKMMRLQILRVVREVLPDASIVYAENGAEVLKAWGAVPAPDLTVLDIHMPLLNGFEVMRHASAAGIRAQPIVVYTASRDDGLRQQCLEAGAAAVVTKSRESIRAGIERALQLRTKEGAYLQPSGNV